MSNLNPEQFGKAPDLESYNDYEDYLQDKRAYDRAVKAGKPYTDPAERTMAKARKADEAQAREEYKPVAQARAAKRKQVSQGLTMVSKGLSAMGMKKPTKRRWK